MNTIQNTEFIQDEELKKEHSETRNTNTGTSRDDNYVFKIPCDKRNDMVIKVNVYKIPSAGGILGRLIKSYKDFGHITWELKITFFHKIKNRFYKCSFYFQNKETV